MQTQEILLVIFTGILAVAVLMQTLIFFGIFKTFRQLTKRMDSLSKDLQGNVEVVTAKAEETLTTIRDIGEGLMPVKDKMVDAADLIHQRVVKVDDFLEETTSSARTEVQRMQTRIESATNRVEEILEMMQDGVMAPINEISALTRGIRAGFDLLFRRRSKASNIPDRTPAQTPDQDEEMFI